MDNNLAPETFYDFSPDGTKVTFIRWNNLWLCELRREHSRVRLISADEVAVRVESARVNARGGRNQYFALYAATQLCVDDGTVAVLSAGSDGIDGNSFATGATIITGSTGHNLRDLRILPADVIG